GQPNVIDLRIRAPRLASRERDLELARQVVKLCVANEVLIQFQREWRSIKQLFRIHTGDGAPRDVAGVVSAGPHGDKTSAPQGVENFRQIFDTNPMQLNVLTNRNVSNAARIAFNNIGDSSRL